jgi:hypothetical protein
MDRWLGGRVEVTFGGGPGLAVDSEAKAGVGWVPESPRHLIT